MNVAEYVVKKIIEYKVTDTFGIPGGVILRLIDAMKAQEPCITPHLNYHEQMAGFAACGYAQASGKLGVAYATRGPGITNMITCIAEAYQESLPVLFITAHGNQKNHGMRFENNQELNILRMVSDITKYAVTIEKLEDVVNEFDKAIKIALQGRKGPVLVDIASSLWIKDVDYEVKNIDEENKDYSKEYINKVISEVDNALKEAKRPVILIGDGIRYCAEKNELYKIADNLGIPIISSRGAQDILSNSEYYYGYVGSHGIRYSNFILSKSDLIIAVGNRLAFPIESKSFAPILKSARLIRIDIDAKEFLRNIQNAQNFELDLSILFDYLKQINLCNKKVKEDWIEVCNEIKAALKESDCTEPVKKIERLMEINTQIRTYVADVGNNEFWVSRAYENVHPNANLLVSKSFGTLGVAIGRAIGAYYATRQPVTCIMGDQGIQYNSQELNYISQWNLPIKIVVINNNISGMIKDHEDKILNGKLIHVDEESGYHAVDIKKLAETYNIGYDLIDEKLMYDSPKIVEIQISSDISLTPNLPKGNSCQDMEPLLERELYNRLNSL